MKWGKVSFVFAFILMFLVSAISIYSQDTISTTDAAPRLPNMEMGLDVMVYDVSSSDSVGDTIYIELEGRNKLGDSASAGLAGYTTWQKVYFNCVSSPDF